jgi:hypothetical protein
VNPDLALSNIEAIIEEIERLDRESSGQFRQALDRECYDTVCRIERKRAQKAPAA